MTSTPNNFPLIGELNESASPTIDHIIAFASSGNFTNTMWHEFVQFLTFLLLAHNSITSSNEKASIIRSFIGACAQAGLKSLKAGRRIDYSKIANSVAGISEKDIKMLVTLADRLKNQLHTTSADKLADEINSRIFNGELKQFLQRMMN